MKSIVFASSVAFANRLTKNVDVVVDADAVAVVHVHDDVSDYVHDHVHV